MEKLVLCKERTCCFTGHRDRDLPYGGDRSTIGMKNLVSRLSLEIGNAIDDGYDTFLSGMAGGIDLICAELVFSMAARGAPVRLVCALPYPQQAENELEDPRDVYVYGMVTSGSERIIVSEKYCAGCYKKRNAFMVACSSRLIGVLKRKTGHSGTLQTIRMAKKAGLDLHVVELDNSPVYYLGSDIQK